MTDPTHQSQMNLLLLEVLSNTRIQALLQCFQRLSTRRQKLLLRIAKGLAK